MSNALAIAAVTTTLRAMMGLMPKATGRTSWPTLR